MEESKLIFVMRQEIRKELDEEYTEYKKKKLEELDIELENKRNEVVKKILDGIVILKRETHYDGEIHYTINIKS